MTSAQREGIGWRIGTEMTVQQRDALVWCVGRQFEYAAEEDRGSVAWGVCDRVVPKDEKNRERRVDALWLRLREVADGVRRGKALSDRVHEIARGDRSEKELPDAWVHAICVALRGIGKRGAALADTIREKERDVHWLVLAGEYLSKPLYVLADALWSDEVSENDRLSPGAHSIKGNRYAKVDRRVREMNWAFGAPGKEEPNTPGMIVSRSAARVGEAFSLLPMDLRLGLEHVRRATGQQAMSVLAAKIAIVGLASPVVRRGAFGEVTIGELTEMTCGTRLKRDMDRVNASLGELKGIEWILPEVHEQGWLFEITRAYGEFPEDTIVRIRLSEMFRRAAWGKRNKGQILINLDGALRISGRHPLALRLYIEACAVWNESRLTRKEPVLPVDEWAARTNAASDRLVRFRKHRQAIGEAAQYLEELGLARAEVAGRGASQRLTLKPPPELDEAYRAIRKRGARYATKGSANRDKG